MKKTRIMDAPGRWIAAVTLLAGLGIAATLATARSSSSWQEPQWYEGPESRLLGATTQLVQNPANEPSIVPVRFYEFDWDPNKGDVALSGGVVSVSPSPLSRQEIGSDKVDFAPLFLTRFGRDAVRRREPVGGRQAAPQSAVAPAARLAPWAPEFAASGP
jgi:hypothetical protein